MKPFQTASHEPPLPVEEAQRRALAAVTVLDAEPVPFADAHGRVLREDILAARDSPERDNSAMDGYAVRARDLPGELRVTGEVAAGEVPNALVEQGCALRIMTGAYVPDGADAVVAVELTDGGAQKVRIERAVKEGANIRRRGEDVRAGSTVLRNGLVIGAAEIALLAAVQKTVVDVGRRPVIAIFATGNELVEAEQPLPAGSIVNTNTPLLAALVRDAGGIPRNLGIVRDDLDATKAALHDAATSDMIVTSGGVSVGAYDFIKEALESLGAEMSLWRVAMKPGKPLVVARLRDRPFFGLPGNPASCFVAFHLFVGPAIRTAMGQKENLFPPELRARTTVPLRSAGDRRLYVRVRLMARDGALIAEPLQSQGSGSLTSMAGANGLAIVDRDIEAGEEVRVLLLEV